jgi:ABC-2 type transport system ATP-binding protein
MHAGRIVRSGSPTQIAAGHASTISFAELPGSPSAPERLAGTRGVAHEHGRTVMQTDRLQVTLSDLLTWAALNHITLDDLDARSPSLETVFLAIADGSDSGASPAEPHPNRTEGAHR